MNDSDDDENDESWDEYFSRSRERVFTALADPVRRYLLELLVYGSAPAGSLAASAAATFGISQSRASQHLQLLARAELVDVWPDGLRRDYALRDRGFTVVTDWIESLSPERAAGRGSG